MGFFRNAGMVVHAHSIAAKFAAIRNDHFDTTILNIEQVLGRAVILERRALGGEADIALKGYQLFTFVRFMRTKGYVSEQYEQQVFCGMLIDAAWMPQRAAVDEFCMKINKCGDDFVKQAASVTVPISLFVLGEPNAAAWEVVGTLLPGFVMATQYAVANEYGDKPAMKRLREDIEGFQRCIEDL